MFWFSKPQFPPRNNNSLEDNMRLQTQRTAFADMNTYEIIASWNDVFKQRPLDIPFYTALNNRACVLIYISTRAVWHHKTIDKVLSSRRQWSLHLAAFVDGSFPILRCNLTFPDKPENPLYLESPLDIRNGDVQEFCKAILADAHIDIMLKHEQNEDVHHGFECHGPGLKSILKKELRRVLRNFQPNSTDADFKMSVRLLESVFPSPGSGLDRAKTVPLIFDGEPHNRFVRKSF